MVFNPTINVLITNNSYETLLYKKYFSAGLGAVALVGGAIAQNFFSGPNAMPFAMCTGLLIGRAIGINTVLSKVRETIENRVNTHYAITMQEAKSLIDDELFLCKLANGTILITGIVVGTQNWSSSPQGLLFGVTLGWYFGGKAWGIKDSLETLGLPSSVVRSIYD